MKTIRRNSKKGIEILDNAKDIVVYRVDNGFYGRSCDPLDYKGEKWLLQKWQSPNHARLSEMAPGLFRLHIHSNCWYEFAGKEREMEVGI